MMIAASWTINQITKHMHIQLKKKIQPQINVHYNFRLSNIFGKASLSDINKASYLYLLYLGVHDDRILHLALHYTSNATHARLNCVTE
jgi:hypothetical protein